MAQRPPAIGFMESRQSWQTGKREIFTNAVPQTRQSEGNKTANRLSAICAVHPWPLRTRLTDISPAREAIEGLATAALAWLARILSQLLLKTASVLPAKNPFGGPLCDCLLTSSIAATGLARQRYDRIAVPGLASS